MTDFRAQCYHTRQASRLLKQRRPDGVNDRPPIAQGCLPEQAQARVPGAIAASLKPAPICSGMQQNPGRAAQGPGQMRGSGIRRN